MHGGAADALGVDVDGGEGDAAVADVEFVVVDAEDGEVFGDVESEVEGDGSGDAGDFVVGGEEPEGSWELEQPLGHGGGVAEVGPGGFEAGGVKVGVGGERAETEALESESAPAGGVAGVSEVAEAAIGEVLCGELADGDFVGEDGGELACGVVVEEGDGGLAEVAGCGKLFRVGASEDE